MTPIPLKILLIIDNSLHAALLIILMRARSSTLIILCSIANVLIRARIWQVQRSPWMALWPRSRKISKVSNTNMAVIRGSTSSTQVVQAQVHIQVSLATIKEDLESLTSGCDK